MVLPFAEVVPTTLFHAEPFRWRVASRALTADAWLQFDPDDLPGDLAEKERLLAAGAFEGESDLFAIDDGAVRLGTVC